MSICERRYQGILKVIEQLNSGLGSRQIRESAGFALMSLLRADQFASFVWNDGEQRFTECVFFNMDPDNLERYYSYYQFHNPISGKTQALRRAVHVNELIPQRELIRTEFYNDFLARDRLYYGMNLYVHDGDDNIGDMRIWRARNHSSFSEEDLQTLEIIKPHFLNAMKNIRRLTQNVRQVRAESGGAQTTEREILTVEQLKSRYALTSREAQVTLEAAHGKTDHEISTSVGMAFSTVRSHLNHVFRKLGVHSRAALSNMVRSAA